MDTLCRCCPKSLSSSGLTTTPEGAVSLGESSDATRGGDGMGVEGGGAWGGGDAASGGAWSRRSSRRRRMFPEMTGMTSTACVTMCDNGRSDAIELLTTVIPP